MSASSCHHDEGENQPLPSSRSAATAPDDDAPTAKKAKSVSAVGSGNTPEDRIIHYIGSRVLLEELRPPKGLGAAATQSRMDLIHGVENDLRLLALKRVLREDPQQCTVERYIELALGGLIRTTVVSTLLAQLTDPWEVLKRNSRKLEYSSRNTVALFATTVSHDTFTARFVPVPCYVGLTIPTLRDGHLLVFVGDSGSGKTMTMLRAGDYIPDNAKKAVIIYLCVWDLITHHIDWTQLTTNGRDDTVKDAILAAITSAVNDECQTALKELGNNDVDIVIAVDEMGANPICLRALCSIVGGVLSGGVQNLLGRHNVYVIAGGTGVDHGITYIGSSPSKFTPVRLNSVLGIQVWKNMVKGCDPGRRKFIELLDKDPTALALASNPRLAAIMYEHAANVDGNCASLYAKSYESFSAAFLQGCAVRYKQLNGLNALTSEDIDRMMIDAVRLVWGLEHLVKDKNNRIVEITCKYGILADHAEWVPASNFTGDPKKIPLQDGASVLWLPPAHLHRFELSGAQCVLMSMRYGYTVMPPTGEGFEISVAQHLQLAVLVFSGAELQELLKHLGVDNAWLTKWMGSSSDHTTTVPYTNVFILQSGSPLSNVKAIGWMMEREFLQFDPTKIDAKSSAYVLVNRPRDSHADMVLVLPRLVAIFIQVKFYGENTVLSEVDMLAELCKMGYVHRTTWLARKAATIKLKDAPKEFRGNSNVQRQEYFTFLRNLNDEEMDFEDASKMSTDKGNADRDRKAFQGIFGVPHVLYAVLTTNIS